MRAKPLLDAEHPSLLCSNAEIRLKSPCRMLRTMGGGVSIQISRSPFNLEVACSLFCLSQYLCWGSSISPALQHRRPKTRQYGMDRMDRDKPEPDGEGQPFLHTQDEQPTHDSGAKSQARRRALGIIRLGVEVAMATVIVLLLATKLSCTPCRQPIRKSPVPDCMCGKITDYLRRMY
jgi:hypothetical protein